MTPCPRGRRILEIASPTAEQPHERRLSHTQFRRVHGDAFRCRGDSIPQVPRWPSLLRGWRTVVRSRIIDTDVVDHRRNVRAR